ncbi:1-deoxy-D-xylulose-5-phosphate reductoisomerase [Priestia megaterium]|uniref:1-deoxy-D-xylulose-5-phosphate reductoisomerase n=1 Tax=Priestia megaterium TaxID=1404 RepID=UPI002452ED53|nr:1-deoxy-D-xylulose-5-phosphate reductoisomerase [Priestia megaterium]MDH3140792.1 1-deoxy-D-xylulose-5-phosphate reductoisomerase [Priestia megaterium]MED4264774.1 1-deoxy-D-xylulose-5-phosphate reductoisomerase [Priestia megaterium]MED4277524.1 1-deoxy-D-xylulose-5-phosphate reductoisomerase [Priestia megaterium]MED4282943.1 1-deoxy-D-xylulose-5-phosphate reductoisomerase [Priestia megaterium]MED4288588.1 1-deoxy-D-xylulose-5-phosphate reductoisomerase [Priestia megaterium]
MKKISLLGATGSIGTQTVDIVRAHPEHFELSAISVGRNINEARKIIQQCKPALVSVMKKEDCVSLQAEFPSIRFVYGEEGLVEVATHPSTGVLVNAVLGSVGLTPTLEAIKMRKTIAIANKETLVTAGHLVMEAAKEYGADILPVDSEHSAIFQSLQGQDQKAIDRLILTASGGSFRDKTRAELQGVTVEDALNHPNWSMGAKITIDSATMMNKGLEVIEAHWLFDLPYEKIDVLLHKESIIHSMVEYSDTSVIAQLGTPDMRVPIQYALTYPKRMSLPNTKRLSLANIGQLHFAKMDEERFRCLAFAFEAGKEGGTLPTVLNAANEEAVQAFLDGHITFLQIEDVIEKAMNEHTVIQKPCLSTIKEVDLEAREFVRSAISR